MTHILILFAGLILGYIIGRAHNTLANIARQFATSAPEEIPPPPPSDPAEAPTEKLPADDLKESYRNVIFLPGQGRLTPAQQKLRVDLGLATAETLTPEVIAKETRVIIKRRTSEAPYKLIIQKPGKRRRIYPYYNREQAMDAFNACPNRNFPPDTSVILDDTLAPK